MRPIWASLSTGSSTRSWKLAPKLVSLATSLTCLDWGQFSSHTEHLRICSIPRKLQLAFASPHISFGRKRSLYFWQRRTVELLVQCLENLSGWAGTSMWLGPARMAQMLTAWLLSVLNKIEHDLINRAGLKRKLMNLNDQFYRCSLYFLHSHPRSWLSTLQLNLHSSPHSTHWLCILLPLNHLDSSQGSRPHAGAMLKIRVIWCIWDATLCKMSFPYIWSFLNHSSVCHCNFHAAR